jgi:hypothetical protein
MRAHRIAAAGHHLQRGFVQQSLHSGGLRLHLVSSLSFARERNDAAISIAVRSAMEIASLRSQ